MFLNGDIDDETDGKSADLPTKTWWMGMGICLFPLYLLFSAFGNHGRGNAAICFGGAVIAVVRLRWNLRNRVWFWILVSILALMHIALIVLVPWPNKDYTLPIILPVGVLDGLAISFLIQVVAKKMGLADNDTADRAV
jgi:hypothetical protein